MDTPPEHQDEENCKIFRQVEAAINLPLLPSYASAIRSRKPNHPAILCKVLPHFLSGSHHIYFQIEFTDSLRWLCQVPCNGYEGAFDESSARALRNEALTMRLIQRETSIPVPEVYDFKDSTDNELRVPFILMEYIDGRPLGKVWYDKSGPADVADATRTQILRDVATAIVQMNKFGFKGKGAILYDEDGSPTGEVGPYRVLDAEAMRNQRKNAADHDGEDNVDIFREVAPTSDLREAAFADSLDHNPIFDDDFGKGLRKLMDILIDVAIDKCTEEEQQGPKFVLTHPHFDIQSFIISKEDGHLKAIIHWTGAITEPQCILGNERYPSWLTRDWDEVVYYYNEETDNRRELSPQQLERYRGIYRNIVGHASDNPAAKKVVYNSLPLENLQIAAAGPMFTYTVMRRIIEEVTKKAIACDSKDSRDHASEDDQDDYDLSNKEGKTGGEPDSSEEEIDEDEEEETSDVDDSFYLHEICPAVAQNELKPEHHRRLVAGFKALLWQDSPASQ
ncbi:hypothetical protein BJX70DRAFT_402634 [Aspergillus crustosus]